MPRSPSAFVLLACLAAAAPAATVGDAVPLFDGRSLAGWQGDEAWWRVDGGAIVGEIPAGKTLERNQFLFTVAEQHDFELTCEYRIGGEQANSGIQFRSVRLDDGEARGYQADLDDGSTWLGRVYEENGRAIIAERGTRVAIAPDGRRWMDSWATPESFRGVAKAGEWNRYRVRAAASHIELWINDVLFASCDDCQRGAAAYAGRIGLQLHAARGPAKIEFRDLRLRELGASEVANPSPEGAAKPTAAITPLGADGKPVNLDFETGTLAGWTATGDAWRDQPIKGDTVRARRGQPSNHAGDWWLGGFERHGDEGTGTLTSSPFVASQPWASFLVGGGADPAHERVEIIDDADAVVFTIGGGNDETMRRIAVDLRGVAGKRLRVRVVDDSAGGWGHINFDDFVLHAEQPVSTAPQPRWNQSPVLWHLEANPAKPSPVANDEAQGLVASMRLTHGFQAELIAAEPDVVQPIAFTFDERGRMWVVEALSYPAKRPDGQGKDRIVILEDKDGDGVFETRTVFCEGLNLVSGIEVGYGGVFVGAAPQLLFIADRDHDDRPDGPPEVLLDGFGYGDTHETLNSFLWGPDGWLYGNQGVFSAGGIGRPGTPDDQRLRIAACVWRYHPLTHAVEVFANGGSNQWGIDFNDVGHLFITHCRSFFGGGGASYVIRNGVYWNQTNGGFPWSISNEAPDFAPDLRNYLPASAKYDDGVGGAGKPGSDVVYGGHAHVGTLIYQGDNFPAIYREHLLTNNIFGQQLNHEENVPTGSGYETFHAGYDLWQCADPTYLPVALKTGPDGAVYVTDWSDSQHCHTSDVDRWNRATGRIYRMSWAATWHPTKVDLTKASDVELVRLQLHPNDWYGRTARRLLAERATARAIEAEAVRALSTLSRDAQPGRALRGLWALHLIKALDGDGLDAAAHHREASVRAWAVQLATEAPGAPLLAPATLAALAGEDASAAVRLALASALPALPDDLRWSLGVALARHGEDANDRFLPRVLWTGLADPCARDWAKALELARATALPSLADSIRWAAARDAHGRDALVARLVDGDEAAAVRGVRVLAFALRNEPSVPAPAGWAAARARCDAAGGDAKAAAEELAAVFGDAEVLARMRAELADAATPRPQLRRAFDLLRRVGDAQALPLFAALLVDDELRPAVIPLLGRSDDPAVAEALIARVPSLPDAQRTAALGALTGRAALAIPLLRAVQLGRVSRALITPIELRQLRGLKDAEVDRLVDVAVGVVNESSAAQKATMARYRQLWAAAKPGDADIEAGRAVFTRTCTLCHARGGVGGRIGPDLGGSARLGAGYFIDNIVDPNAVVGEAYQLNVVTKTDGSVLMGMIDQESDTVLTLRTPAGSVNVPKKEIKDRQKQAQSMMPPGLLETMSDADVIALLKFLTTDK